MVHIPPGEFDMGSWEGNESEQPVHRVYLDGYQMDIHEVTVAEIREFNPDYEPNLLSSCDDCPATDVTWEDAYAYCESVGKRLPTEAEWEKACQGPGGWMYSWGTLENERNGRFGLPREDGALPVGSHGTNGYGLYDMSGNVWEWVQDWYGSDYYSESSYTEVGSSGRGWRRTLSVNQRQEPMSNPEGPSKGRNRVIRGGAWCFPGVFARCTSRNNLPPRYRGDAMGFRCAK